MPRRRPAKAKGLALTAHLTAGGSPELERAIRRTYAGQAHFAIGPACCASCAFFGYWQQVRARDGAVIGTVERESSCRRHYELTGHHGPGIPANALACRHYQRKPGA